MKRIAASLLAVGAIAAAGLLGLGGAASAAGTSSLPTLNLTLTGKTISASGTLSSGAVNVVSTTTAKDAEPTLFRLNAGLTPAVLPQLLQAVQKHNGDLNYVAQYGRLVFDADAPKGTTAVQTVLAAGTYLALDTESNGVPPSTSFTVAQTPTGTPEVQLPAAGATINAIEYGFTGAKTIHTGELVRFTNQGFLVHMNLWAKTKDAATAKQAIALLAQGKDKKAGKLFTDFGQFMGPVSSGAVQQQVVTAKPGTYVMLCFMTTQDGREHTRLGMARVLKITK